MAGVAGSGLIGATTARAADGTRRFAIFRDGDEIGEHTLTLTTRGDVQEMRIYILIEIFVLGFRGFVYEHRNTEIWRDGQLQSISTTTDNDGDDEFCNAQRDGDALLFEGTAFNGRGEGDRTPTSYWHRSELPWFSSQTGKQLSLNLQKSRAGAFERWSVTGDFEVTLDYDDDGEWRGCSFPSRGGELVTYRQTEAGPRFNA